MSLPNPIIVPLSVVSNTLNVGLSVLSDSTSLELGVAADSENIPVECQYVIEVGEAERYEGAYEFVPSSETQTIQINHKMATANIIIDPIPTNYGLVTWNGSVITVS